MDGIQLISMEPNMLLSIVNMKLRDEYSSLKDFCEDMDISKEALTGKMEKVGYIYNDSHNQFILK